MQIFAVVMGGTSTELVLNDIWNNQNLYLYLHTDIGYILHKKVTPKIFKTDFSTMAGNFNASFYTLILDVHTYIA